MEVKKGQRRKCQSHADCFWKIGRRGGRFIFENALILIGCICSDA